MFDFLKNVFQGKLAADGSEGKENPGIEIASPPTLSPPPAPKPPGGSEPVPKPRASGNGTGEQTSVEVPLQLVLNGFPLELKGRIKQSDVGEATVSIPLDKVLPQLSLGSVKITFGELRRAAPQLFCSGTDCDQVQVALPLNEILLQINPALFPRRQNQKRIEVPEDVRSPFGDRGNGLIFSVGPTKSEVPAAPRQAAPMAPASPRSVTPVPPPSRPAAPATPPLRSVTPAAPPRPQSITPAPPPQLRSITPAPPQPRAAATPSPVQQQPAPPAAPAQPKPIRLPPLQTINPPISPLTPQQPIPSRSPMGSAPSAPPLVNRTPAVPPPTSLPLPAFRGLGALAGAPPAPAVPPQSTPPRPPAVPLELPSQPLKPAVEVASLSLSLISLAEGWPEALRHEIVQLNLTDAKIALPVETIEQALKQGKVAFPWKTLRSWIKPAPAPAVSVHDNAVVELPLKVIAPLFLNRQKDTSKPQQKVAIDANIPNLFFGLPQPGAPSAAEAAAPLSHAVAKPADTNYYFAEDTSDTTQASKTEFQRKPQPSLGTSFVTRCATPNEVVSRASALEGVAGALIALPDGLMVASRLSADLNGDTLAAFLPHIFGKVSQCTKELRMGELNNLNFTVGNVPWKIFRVNAIFFAAFGHPGQPLPTAQLAALASELDRKKQ